MIRVEEQVFLCLPKSVSVRNGESQEEKEKRLLKYARLLEQYFQEVKKCSEDINFVPIYPWCVDTLVSWCEIRNPWSSEQKDVGVIAAVKFEKVCEWLIGWLYRNHFISPEMTCSMIVLSCVGRIFILIIRRIISMNGSR